MRLVCVCVRACVFVHTRHDSLSYHLPIPSLPSAALPEQLTQCAKLESLQVDNNNLASLPPSLSNLKNFKSVSFAQSQLESFPNSLCHLGKLELLDLNSNKIIVLPEDI